MSLKKLRYKTTAQDAGLRLDQLLATWLPQALQQDFSRSRVRKLIVTGGVYLNQHRVRIASKPLVAGALIEVFISDAAQKTGARADAIKHETRQLSQGAPEILYEDAHLIAINKPAGIPTQPTVDEARVNLFQWVKDYLQTRLNHPAQTAYVGLHHRLDRDTSGVILMTLTKQANPGMARVFADHLATKTYWALCEFHPVNSQPAPQPGATWSVRNFLKKAPKTPGKNSNFFKSVHSGGDAAETDFRLIKIFTPPGEAQSPLYFIEAKPKTGRTHQIRVHLSEAGLPIVGDTVYGASRKIKAPRMLLHACRIDFPHPVTNQPMSIESRMPEDFDQFLNRASTAAATAPREHRGPQKKA